MNSNQTAEALVLDYISSVKDGQLFDTESVIRKLNDQFSDGDQAFSNAISTWLTLEMARLEDYGFIEHIRSSIYRRGSVFDRAHL